MSAMVRQSAKVSRDTSEYTFAVFALEDKMASVLRQKHLGQELRVKARSEDDYYQFDLEEDKLEVEEDLYLTELEVDVLWQKQRKEKNLSLHTQILGVEK